MQQPDTNLAPGAGPLRPPGWRQDLLDLLRQDWHGERKQLQEAILHLAAGLDDNTVSIGVWVQTLADLRTEVQRLRVQVEQVLAQRSTWNLAAGVCHFGQPDDCGTAPKRCALYPACACGHQEGASQR